MKQGQKFSFLTLFLITSLFVFNNAHAAITKTPTTDVKLQVQPEQKNPSQLEPTVKTLPVTPQTQPLPVQPKLKTTPIQPRGLTLSPALEKPILSVSDPYCFTDLYGDMKRTFNQVSHLCTYIPNPPVQSYKIYRERMDYNFFNWNLSKCPTLVTESVNKDVHDINFMRMPQATSQCMNKCFTVVNGLLVAGSFSSALSQCEACCGFFPEGDQAQCRVECNQVSKMPSGEVPSGELLSDFLKLNVQDPVNNSGSGNTSNDVAAELRCKSKTGCNWNPNTKICDCP